MDSLTNYQSGKSRLHHSNGTISVETASRRTSPAVESIPVEVNNIKAEENKVLTPEIVKDMLRFEKSVWLLLLAESDGDCSAAETAAKNKIKTD